MQTVPQQVATELLSKFNGDTKQALDNFMSETESRFTDGGVPKPEHVMTLNLLSQLVPIQDEIDKIAVGSDYVSDNNPILDILAHERISDINNLLGDQVFDSPEVDVDYNDIDKRIFQLEQAVIELGNKVPHLKGDKRFDVLNTLDILSREIEMAWIRMLA